MPRTQAHHPFGRLTQPGPLGRWLDAVVHGVTQQVDQWRLQPIQHVAIGLGAFPLQFKPHLPAQLAAQVAHHAYLAGHQVGTGAHARRQGSVVEPVAALAKVPGKAVELCAVVLQVCLGLLQLVASAGQQGLHGGRQRVALQGPRSPSSDWPICCCSRRSRH